ncbi:MAG: hypothetical protein ACLS3M_08420 [Collinsella sp.]
MGKSWGKYCWLHSGHGMMTLQSGIANSCDPVFYDMGKAFFYNDQHRGPARGLSSLGPGQDLRYRSAE